MNSQASSVDSLPPTQYLIMEVLAARFRSGELQWTFRARLARPLALLQAAGLVRLAGTHEGGWLRAELTSTGREAVLSEEYEPRVVAESRRLNTLLEDLLDRIPRRLAMNDLVEKCKSCPLRRVP